MAARVVPARPPGLSTGGRGAIPKKTRLSERPLLAVCGHSRRSCIGRGWRFEMRRQSSSPHEQDHVLLLVKAVNSNCHIEEEIMSLSTPDRADRLQSRSLSPGLLLIGVTYLSDFNEVLPPDVNSWRRYTATETFDYR